MTLRDASPRSWVPSRPPKCRVHRTSNSVNFQILVVFLQNSWLSQPVPPNVENKYVLSLPRKGRGIEF
jgi:hypothetical protein